MKRKIDHWLVEWKSKAGKCPALIIGMRQCGKTKSIEHFGSLHYKNIVILDFMKHPEYISDFDGKLEVDALISNISLHFPEIAIEPKSTLLFFDEIQECPRARLSLKSFAKDGRYDVIGSGSYLGINGYVIGDSTPAPTGYEDLFEMRTMDFEEFLWALGFKEEQIDTVVGHYYTKDPVPAGMHETLKEHFRKYLCIGGFPKAVKAYAQTLNLMEAIRAVNSTVFDMKTDFGRRKGKDGKPLFKPAEVARIQSVFDLIPAFLAKESKRFVTSKIAQGSSIEKSDAIEYLRQAHIVYKVHNLETPSLPLSVNKIESQFKLFPADIGILSSMLGLDAIIAINKGELGQAKGAIYEALVFDSLSKAGFDVFYYAKESGLEIDFVIGHKGYATLVEAKAKNGNAKSSKTVMKHPEHYGKTKLIKIGDYNISEEGDIITIPHYLTFALGKERERFLLSL